MSNVDDEVLASQLVATVVADMKKDKSIKFRADKQSANLRLMNKILKRRSDRVIRALSHCLENFYTIEEIKSYGKAEFATGEKEADAFDMAVKMFLSGDKSENYVNAVKAYLRHSQKISKAKNAGRVAAAAVRGNMLEGTLTSSLQSLPASKTMTEAASSTSPNTMTTDAASSTSQDPTTEPASSTSDVVPE